jgi:hypothetical protein
LKVADMMNTKRKVGEIKKNGRYRDYEMGWMFKKFVFDSWLGQQFFFLQSVQTNSVVHPACTQQVPGHFTGKKWLGERMTTRSHLVLSLKNK